jgi:hypothetical protein
LACGQYLYSLCSCQRGFVVRFSFKWSSENRTLIGAEFFFVKSIHPI